MTQFPCPYLKGDIKLTVERGRHITERHPDLLPRHRERLAETLASPDQVRRSSRFGGATLFSRCTMKCKGEHLVVVVVSQPDVTTRHWIITAYWTRRLAAGEIEWTRN